MGTERVAVSLQPGAGRGSRLVDDAEGGVLVGRARVEAQDAGGALHRVRVPLAPVRGRLVLVDEVREEDVELVALRGALPRLRQPLDYYVHTATPSQPSVDGRRSAR